MIISIHQPNFFPWLGFFRKIALADRFVFLDAVEFPQSSRGTWTNRVGLLVGSQKKWSTCPIKRVGRQLIADVKIDDNSKWRSKFLRTLEMNYSRTSYFKVIYPSIEQMLKVPTDSLAEFNIGVVEAISKRLELQTEFFRQTLLRDPASFELTGSERLARICKILDGNVYLSGDGADEYEREDAYLELGIRLRRSGFQHPVYSQYGSQTFVPGLSILDAVFNLGFDETRSLICENRPHTV